MAFVLHTQEQAISFPASTRENKFISDLLQKNRKLAEEKTTSFFPLMASPWAEKEPLCPGDLMLQEEQELEFHQSASKMGSIGQEVPSSPGGQRGILGQVGSGSLSVVVQAEVVQVREGCEGGRRCSERR